MSMHYKTDSEKMEASHHGPPKPGICPQLPGTVLRIFIPPGAVINLLNILEVTSPGGICLIVRLPLLGGSLNFHQIFDSIKAAGGTVEVVNENK